jgi:hypothetical protein
VVNYRAELKAPAALKAFIEHKDESLTAFARRVSGELSADGSTRKVSRQMIAFLANGDLTFCTPELAGAIERALDLPEHTLFSLVPKSRDKRQTVKGRAA